LTEQELHTEEQKLKTAHNKAINELYKKYADENAKFKVGDIIRNNYCIGKITSIEYSFTYGCIVYECDKIDSNGNNSRHGLKCSIIDGAAERFVVGGE